MSVAPPDALAYKQGTLPLSYNVGGCTYFSSGADVGPPPGGYHFEETGAHGSMMLVSNDASRHRRAPQQQQEPAVYEKGGTLFFSPALTTTKKHADKQPAQPHKPRMALTECEVWDENGTKAVLTLSDAGQLKLALEDGDDRERVVTAITLYNESQHIHFKCESKSWHMSIAPQDWQATRGRVEAIKQSAFGHR
eukprot:TRINITY_DN1840_c2_g1_i1.p2 TRINITY_DN1840_c2_g1~~TRINITY_DN1840_c2_g1_i1.p2  ORF type:complete len:222 (+),score=87.01 TRINITY_DN1840_c2_g1_i1:85-666(+)